MKIHIHQWIEMYSYSTGKYTYVCSECSQWREED